MSLLDTTFDLEVFKAQLNEELNKGLPGFDAQKIMSPSIREHALKKSDPSLARDSSVLLLFYPKNGQLYLPFMKRTTGNTSHSGQISLPGGKYEESDTNRTVTAIRETNEELGVDCKKIKILGFLTELYIPVSNFMVLPVLGYCKQRPEFKLNPHEVEEVIEMPVQELLAEKNISEFSFNTNGHKINAPYFDAKGHKVWGATAMILSELRELFLRAGLIR
ncbi:NUDIX hydrolase [Marinifilum caeruleilacunae]|uniref:CoA pyrophosphatase n=1 Tax=Marinifilum caeruleilacunae TaxID=2499076 RepID=A0ABX1X1B6_9BACT|nr:CoA pyrophosphatase [Marinifilum caeruleilacunae]NOU62109.1 CoA pyrophosphatase [Marinifilum caeruleilacunae]